MCVHEWIWMKESSKLRAYDVFVWAYEWVDVWMWTKKCLPLYMLICTFNKSVKTPLDASNHFSDKINIPFSLRFVLALTILPIFCVQYKVPHVDDCRGCMTTVSKWCFKHRKIYRYHIGAALFLERVCFLLFFFFFNILHHPFNPITFHSALKKSKRKKKKSWLVVITLLQIT